MTATLSFLSPPPGLAPLTDFQLREITGAAGLFALQSAVDLHTRLFVLDASVYLPDYSPVWDPLESTCRHASLSIL